MEPGGVLAERVPVADDMALDVRCWGADESGIPVLALHPLGGTGRHWDGLGPLLAAAGHAVAAPDLRGHGPGGRPNPDVAWTATVSDALAVIRHRGWHPGSDRRPIVVGAGWGATVAVEMAARHPDAVRALVLVDGGATDLSGRFADWPTCAVALAPPPITGADAARHERLIRARHPEWPETGLASLLADVEVRGDGTLRPWLGDGDHSRYLLTWWRHHPAERWAALDLPVVLLASRHPDLPDARWSKALHDEVDRAGAALPRSSVRWITSEGDLHLARPGEVARAVMEVAGER